MIQMQQQTPIIKIPPFRERLNDGSYKYNLTPPQLRALQSEARFVVLMCGAQLGKTILQPIWMYQQMQRFGDGDYIAGTTNFPLMDKKFLPAFEEHFHTILKLGKYKDKGNKFEFYNGKTTIFFFTAEKPASIESATAICASLDEVGQDEWKEKTWDAVLSRLSIASNPVSEGGLGAGRALLTTTLYNFGWLKYKVYDEWLRGDPLYDVIHADSIENPTFSVAEYNRLKATMSTSEFDLRYRGRYTKPAGLIYDSFDSKNCVKSREFSPIQNNWAVYCGMDFGNDTAAVFYAVDPATGLFYCFAEYKESGRTTAQHVEALQKICPRERIIKCCGGKGDPGDDGWRNDFTNAGWAVQMPNVRSVEVGIQRVYAFHKLNQLYYFSDLTKILAEKTSYSYKLDDQSNPTGDIQDKQKYHLMDSERSILSEFNLSASRYELRPIRSSYGY